MRVEGLTEKAVSTCCIMKTISAQGMRNNLYARLVQSDLVSISVCKFARFSIALHAFEVLLPEKLFALRSKYVKFLRPPIEFGSLSDQHNIK
jgi:hypothetical protein